MAKGNIYADLPGGRTMGARRPARTADWPHQVIRLLRPHQWAKNLLILVPLAISHQFDWGDMLSAARAFLAFSLTASSAYVINDMLDRAADRNHATKKGRPFASGALPLWAGFLLVPLLLFGAIALTFTLPTDFQWLLGFYFALTCAYSIRLKRMLVADVVTLGCLYALRVIAGGAAIDAVISEWLVAFSLLFFLSLALIKRYVEFARLVATGKARVDNRSYRVEDLPVLLAVAAAAAFNAVTVLMRYLGSEDIESYYRHPERLWLMTPVLIYWIARMILLAHRLKVDDDPVIFALRDARSLFCAGVIGGIMIWAA